jgi:YrbI family 3-deoxy-D-manno-octulosonate 8-phosphate phosphatase
MKSKIKLVAMDVDGVLTDGGMYYSESGEVMKKFNTRDGMGVSLLHEHGIIPAIITQEENEIVLKRAEKLKVEHVYIGAKDKCQVMRNLVEQLNVGYDEVVYIGDDLNDLEVMKMAGWSFAPADAAAAVREAASQVLSRRGGEGAVREAVDIVLGNRPSD